MPASKEVISSYQFMVLVALFIIGDAILLAPYLTVNYAKQDAWISAVLVIIQSLLLVPLYYLLQKQHPNVPLTLLTERILGKWVGKLITFLLICFFFINSSLMLWEVADFLQAQIIDLTPFEVILIMFSLAIIYGSWVGIENFARSTELFFPWYFLLFFVLLFSLLPQINWDFIRPISGEWRPILLGDFYFFANMLENITLLVFLAAVKDIKKGGKALLMGTLIGNTTLAMFVILPILVMGPDLTAVYMYPPYALAQEISLARFFERIEVLLAFMWFISLYVKLTTTFYATMQGIQHLFSLQVNKFLALPLGMLLAVAPLYVVPDRSYFTEYVTTSWFPYSLTFGFLLPLILLLVALMRKKGRERERWVTLPK